MKKKKKCQINNSTFFSQAFGIMQMEGIRGLHGWQWIFILESIPTLVLAFVAYFCLPDFPENSKCRKKRDSTIIVNILGHI